jgi:multidrug efflux pump
VVTVRTNLVGASSEVIESQITKPLEDSIAGIDGVDILTSISRSEQSQITVRFKLSKPPEAAAADVRDRVARVRGRLPEAADEPVIAKVEADATPVIFLAFTSETLSPLDVTDIVNRVVKPRLQTVPGVADVQINGDRKYSMRIWLDPDRLAAYRITVQDVEDALRKQNLEVPAGRIESQQREFSVTSRTDLNTAPQFSDIALKQAGGYTVRLRDVARIEEGAASERSYVRLNGVPSVSAGIIRNATANPLEVSSGVRDVMPQIQRDLPNSVKVVQANDNSVFIDRSIRSVYTTVAEAVALVALVVFVFLRTLRASIIPLVTIPVSLIGAFALMAAAGFTINTLTLLALVLAIGLVVDDAIVVLENIFRHIEEGFSPFQAAIKGAREIAFAVVAMTLTLAAVFAPLAFTPGRTGRLFVEFALTLAGAVIVSGFVALTLTPMLCSKLLRHNPSPGWFDRTMERFLVALTAGYRAALGGVLRHSWIVALVMLASAAGSWWLFSTAKSELSPLEDRGVLILPVTSPEGSTLDYTRRYLDEVGNIASRYPEFDRVFVFVGGGFNSNVSQGTVVLRAVDWDERQRTTQELARALQPQLSMLPGVQAFPITPPSLGQGFRAQPINFVVVSNESYEDLQRATQAIVAEMQKNPGFVQPDTDLRLNKPELLSEVDRNRAADQGVAPQSLNHFNRLRAVKVTATLAPGYALDEALSAMDRAAKAVLPATAQTDVDGQSREFRKSGKEIYFTFVLALLFIYLVLSAQFESFVHPFVIMLSVPLSMTGALFVLWLTGGTLNIYSQVGLVTLVGLITKHGILIVEFSNQLRAKGEALMDAVVDAATLRLRPILMTTGAMVLGALPLALAHGAGAESRTQIGWVIVGGMSFGTLLTLFVVPTAYTLLAGRTRHEREAAHAAALATGSLGSEL